MVHQRTDKMFPNGTISRQIKYSQMGLSADWQNVLKWDHQRTDKMFPNATISRQATFSQMGPSVGDRMFSNGTISRPTKCSEILKRFLQKLIYKRKIKVDSVSTNSRATELPHSLTFRPGFATGN
jgi:hypothetical protein